MFKYFLGFATVVSAATNSTTYMKKFLDEMAVYYSEGSYDPVYYEKLTTCMAKDNDTLLIPSQNNAWKGMLDYWKINGTSKDYMNQSDHWGECTPSDKAKRCLVGPY